MAKVALQIRGSDKEIDRAGRLNPREEQRAVFLVRLQVEGGFGSQYPRYIVFVSCIVVRQPREHPDTRC